MKECGQGNEENLGNFPSPATRRRRTKGDTFTPESWLCGSPTTDGGEVTSTRLRSVDTRRRPRPYTPVIPKTSEKTRPKEDSESFERIRVGLGGSESAKASGPCSEVRDTSRAVGTVTVVRPHLVRPF